MNKCSSCVYFKGQYCHRMPPIGYDEQAYPPRPMFPRTTPDSFCGEWAMNTAFGIAETPKEVGYETKVGEPKKPGRPKGS